MKSILTRALLHILLVRKSILKVHPLPKIDKTPGLRKTECTPLILLQRKEKIEACHMVVHPLIPPCVMILILTFPLPEGWRKDPHKTDREKVRVLISFISVVLMVLYYMQGILTLMPLASSFWKRFSGYADGPSLDNWFHDLVEMYLKWF